MAHSIELVHRFRPWRALWPKKIDPKTGQHEEAGNEDEPIRAPPPDASRSRIFAHRNRDLLLPSKNERIVHSSLAATRLARGKEKESGIFRDSLQSNEEALAHSQLKTTRRVPQVRCLNLGLVLTFSSSVPRFSLSNF